MGWGGWLLMSVTALAFWALVVFAVIALFRGGRSDTPPRSRAQERDADQILDMRFARGEIDADEYHARQQVLHSAP
jgi:putative membrane protein